MNAILRRFIGTLAVLCLFFLPGSPLFPSCYAAGPEVVLLQNGVHLIVINEPESETVTTEVLFRVGQADEGARVGINALIARTWARGSEFRTEAMLQADLAGVGSVTSDFGPDWVELRGVSGNDASDLHKMMQTLLTNLVAGPRFAPEKLTASLLEQQAHIAQEKDAISRDALATLRGRVWGASPYGQPPFGDTDHLSLLPADTVMTYYTRLFRPERCWITVAGKVDAREIESLVRASLAAGDWNSAPPAPRFPPIIIEPIPRNLRDRLLPRRAPAAILLLGYQAPGAAEGREDYAGMLVLDAALGGGKTSRLFATLREGPTPVGYDIRTLFEPNRARSLWTAYIIGDTDPIACRDALKRELDALADGSRPFTDAQANRARAFVKTRHLRERQRQRDRAFGVCWSELMGLGASFDTDFDSQIDAVTTDSLNQLARRILGSPSAAVYTQTLIP